MYIYDVAKQHQFF